VFHNFTLLHDDIMDNAETRRNRLTVHKKWNANTAILSGDAMMIKSYEFLENTPAHLWTKLFPIFTRTALEVCEGQQYDMNFETCEEVTLDEYFNNFHINSSLSIKYLAILYGTNESEEYLLYDSCILSSCVVIYSSYHAPFRLMEICFVYDPLVAFINKG